MMTALTLPQRAAVALGTAEHEKDLIALALQSADIIAVTNVDGRDQAHRVGMTLRNARTGITKAGKLARDDATAFGKAVIAEEKRLIAIVEPEEERVLVLRDAWDAAEQARKDALIAAERARVDGIKSDIQAIRNMAITVAGKPSQIMSAAIEILGELFVTEDRFAEFVADASCAIVEATDAITTMHGMALLVEAEALRAQQEKDAAAALFKKQQVELAEQQAQLRRDQIAAADAEQKRRDLIESDRVAKVAADRALFDAQLKADANRAQEQRAAQEKIDAQNEALHVERVKFDAEKAALIAPESIAEIVATPESLPTSSPAMNFIKRTAPPEYRPTAAEVIEVLMEHYDESEEVVADWLQTMFSPVPA